MQQKSSFHFLILCIVVLPENCTVEDTIKVMETVCSMAQKRRAYDKGEVGPFGFNKKPDEEKEKDVPYDVGA